MKPLGLNFILESILKLRRGIVVGTAVKLSESIVADAKIISKAFNRSIAGQIEHWAKIGKIAEENPDLTYELIKNILVAQQEVFAGKLDEYHFDKK